MRYIFYFLSSVVLLCTSAAGGTVVVDNNDSQNIEDKQCFDKTFSVSGIDSVSKVTMEVNIDHTWRGDLDISLISPAGTTVDLTSDNGGSKDNLYVVFDDAAETSITGDNTNHTQTVYRKPEEPLGDFYGEDPSGTWTLHICDDARGDQGTYNYGRLTIYDIEGALHLNFKMDECYWLGGANGVDDDVKDSSVNGLDAQSRNRADKTQADAKLCRAGDFNNTYSNPNLSDAVFYPNETAAEQETAKNPPFTVMAWIKRRSGSDRWMAAIIRVSDESWSDGWGIEHASGSGDNIDFFVGGYDTYIRAAFPTDRWVHVAATYDGSVARLYIDGAEVGNSPMSQTSYTAASKAIVIGDDVSGSSIDDRWQGEVDEVKVWHRVLTAQEIEAVYNHENNGNNYDGTPRLCKQCNGSSIGANSWDLIGIPVELRGTGVTVEDVFADDMNGTYDTDWKLYKRVYSTTDNSSSYEKLSLTDTLEFGVGYWLGSRNSSEWFVDGLDSVDYNATDTACVRAPCVEIDLTPVTHDFETDGNDGTGPYRYNMSGFIGLQHPVSWADCRFVIDGTAYTPSDANASGYASKQIWLYNGTGTDKSNSYITCDDTMECKLVPFKGFWVELHGKTKGKSVKLLIPKE